MGSVDSTMIGGDAEHAANRRIRTDTGEHHLDGAGSDRDLEQATERAPLALISDGDLAGSRLTRRDPTVRKVQANGDIGATD